MDLPPTRKGYEGEPGYDEVLSRTYNPFELKAIASEAGLRDVDVLFYHFHAFPLCSSVWPRESFVLLASIWRIPIIGVGTLWLQLS